MNISKNADHSYRVMRPLDLAQGTLGGKFGRRVERIIEANILKIDVDQVFLKPFRQRVKGDYIGFGKFLDAIVRLAYATGDARLRTLKSTAIQALLVTQKPDSYLGIIQAPESSARGSRFFSRLVRTALMKIKSILSGLSGPRHIAFLSI